MWLAAAASRLWLAEDAFISFRFARNQVAGHGLVFNPGRPAVEGYSDLLWVELAAALIALGLEPWRAIHPFSLAAGLGTLALTLRVAARHLGVGWESALAATVLLGAFPAFLIWSTSGLEVMPQTFLWFATAALLAFGEGVTAPTALAAVGLVLIRTEGALWLPVLITLAAAVRRAEGRSLRPLGVVGACAGAAFLGLLLWRHAVYGAWIANTARAKGELSAATLARGARYLLWFVGLYTTPALLGLAASAGRARVGAARWWWTVALAASVPTWTVLVGGDYMRHCRFLVPALPVFALVAAWGLDAVRARGGRPLLVAVTGGLLVIAGLPLLDRTLLPTRLVLALETSTPSDHHGPIRLQGGRATVAAQLNDHLLDAYAISLLARPGDVVSAFAIGQIGWFNPDLLFFDRCGLVDREVARRAVEVEISDRPGHDKCVEPSFFLDRAPDIADFQAFASDGDPTERVRGWLEHHLKPFEGEPYVPQLVVLQDPSDGRPYTVVALRRFDDPGERDAAWLRFRSRLRRLPELVREVGG